MAKDARAGDTSNTLPKLLLLNTKQSIKSYFHRHRHCEHDSEAHMSLISPHSERLGFPTLDSTQSSFICI